MSGLKSVSAGLLTLAMVGGVPTHAAGKAAVTTTVRISPGCTEPPGCASRITVSGSRSANAIRIYWIDRETFIVEDTAGTVAGEACVSQTPSSVACPYSQETDLEVSGLKGDDDIAVLNTQHPVGFRFVSGGAGDDRIFSGPGSDSVVGGKGDDLIRGAGGDDRIYGSPGDDVLRGGSGRDALDPDGERDLGRDQFIAGSGDDRINATDQSPDERIRAGSGDDRCRVDRDLDPVPRRCETIAFRGSSWARLRR